MRKRYTLSGTSGSAVSDKSTGQGIRYRPTKEDVLFLKQLIEEGHYRAVVDRRYLLDDVVDATAYVETKQKTGNVVLTLARPK